MDSYEIVCHSKSDMLIITSQHGFWRQANLPFSRLKLEQYITNPYATDEDTLLITISRADEIIAYLAIIPDQVLLDNSPQPVVWPSSWWVSPKHRGKGLAEALMQKVLDLYPYAMINSGTPQALHLLRKSGLWEDYSQRLRSIYLFNLNPQILEFFKRSNLITRTLLPVAIFKLGILHRARLKAWRKQLPTLELKSEFIHTPDPDTIAFLADYWQEDLAFKDPASFKWRLSSSIYTPVLQGIPTIYKTYFGNLGYSHLNYNVKLFQQNSMIGFVNVLISDGMLRFTFFYLRKGMEAQFAAWLAELLLHNPVDAIHCQNPRINAILTGLKMPSLYTKSYPMPIMVSKQLKGLSPGKILQDGDGAF
ncbi:MAG TPA: GNAT family N-acetyltransferase [Candidatus Cloacimonadota bacterium]|nr:GNAT family N-acetyltransferase [Candidatus Cloacimonadota bacterium]